MTAVLHCFGGFVSAPPTAEEQLAVALDSLTAAHAQNALQADTIDSLRLALDRWQEVAYVDAADLAPRARKEGITVDTGREPPWREFLKEFYKKASAY